MDRNKLSLLLLIMLLLASACSSATSASQAKETAPWPTEGWQRNTPEAVGMDSEILADMLQRIQNVHTRVDSVVIVRHGYLVLEAYNLPYEEDELHLLYSCTKSVVSSLIGLAIEQGYIESVEAPVLSFFPDHEFKHMDADKEAMTLEDVLTMSTGLDCRDSYLYDWEGLDEMWVTEDWVQYFLDLPMIHEPGTYFEYCNSATYLLSAIIQETTGMSAHAYAQQELFNPLGITETEWKVNDQGINWGFSGLYMYPTDMAKFGYLFLNEGEWEGNQLLSPEWIAASSTSHIPATLEEGYGYQWWINEDGYYMALGYRGQFIYVIPELDLVVVMVSDEDRGNFDSPGALLKKYLIPAVVSDDPLPENPEAVAEMENYVMALSSP